jgi:hypothetical protein
MCPGAAVSYGELGGRACDDGSGPSCASIGGSDVARGAAAALVRCFGLYRATSHGNRAQDTAMPFRLGTMKSRRLAGT